VVRLTAHFRIERFACVYSSLANTNETNVIDNSAETAQEITQTKVEQATTLDQRVVPVATGYLDGSNDLPPPVSMDESVFTHLDVLKQPIRLATGAWASTDSVSQNLLNVVVPDVFGAFPTIHKQLLQLYAFYKFTLRFRIVINTTRFHAGKLIAFYDPVNTFGTGLDRLADVYAASGYPNVKLDAANSNSAEIDVPFENIVSYLTTNTFEDSPPMGVLRVLVFNPLQLPPGSTDPINFNVFVSAANISLHLPMRPHEATFSLPPTFRANGLSDVINVGKSVAGTITGAWADVKSGNILGALKRGWDFFTSDRPTLADNKIQNCLTTVSQIATMQGLDGSVRLGATQDGHYFETEFSTAPKTDMAIYEIIKRPMLIRQFVWSKNSPVDAQLTALFVAPSICQFSPTTPSAGYTQYHNTFLSYFATMFEYWRGSLTFTFEVAASNFHVGRFMIAFEPNSGTTPLPGVANTCTDYSNNPHFVFDLEQHKECTITIPYVASTPRKRNIPYQAIDSTFHDYDSLGSLVCLVLDPLAVTESVSDTIVVNVYVSAGPDFRFYGPRIRPGTRFLEDFPTPPPMRANAGESSDIVLREPQKTNYLVKGASGVDTPDYFNEEINDVRDLARRFCRYDTVINMVADPKRTGIVTAVSAFGSHPDLYYAANFYTNKPNSAHSFSTLITRLYAFWTGSIRWKFIPFTDRTKDLQMIATYAFTSNGYNPPATDDLTAYPAYITNNSQDSSVEVELPFYSPYTQLLAQDDPAATAYDQGIYTPGYVQLQASSSAGVFTGDSVRITAYHAIGNDVAFRFLIAPPVTYEPESNP
jgi:hypothetical protein